METTCPICFDYLKGKIKASPNTCDHVFCLNCLEKWSKLGSFCPVDRRRFKKIVNLESENQIQVKPRKRKRVKTVYDFSSKCDVCQEDGQDDVLLLCDCCDLAFHMFCLTPPLKTIPSGLWFCPTCVSVEAKLKEKKGITKDVEADLCNAKQQLEEAKRQSDVRRILTRAKKKNSVEESANYGKEFNLDKLKNVRSVNNEQCSSTFEVLVDVISEFQDIDVARKCSQDVSSHSTNSNNSVDKKDHTKSCSSDGTKSIKTYVRLKKKKRERLKVPVQFEMYKLRNSKPKKSRIDDLCRKNDTSKDVSLLDDGFNQAVVYGDMKGEVSEENANHICMTEVDSFNEKCENKNSHSEESELSFNTKFRNLVCEISSRDKVGSQHHPVKIVSVESNSQEFTITDSLPIQKIQENTKPKGPSSGNDSLLPCSSISAESNKGTFNNLISGACVESSFDERPSVEIIESKSTEKYQKGKIQFSVFERIEGNDASQKKYSEINSGACISFSSTLNISHCFSCKDMILAASRNYCKICKLKYMKNSLVSRKISKYAKSSDNSQAFQSSDGSNMGNKPFNFCNERKTSKKWMSAVEKRHYSLLRKLQKIHNSKKKLTDSNK